MARTIRFEGMSGGSRGAGGAGGIVGRSANKPAITAKARGFNKTKIGRKEMKTNDIMINQVGKSARKSGKSGIADAPKSVGVRSTGPKVPVKPKASRTRSGKKSK